MTVGTREPVKIAVSKSCAETVRPAHRDRAERSHLYRLAVRPDARRRGIGPALLAEAEKRLVALGATRIEAMVLEGNELGQSIWGASGYRAQDEWRRWERPLA